MDWKPVTLQESSIAPAPDWYLLGYSASRNELVSQPLADADGHCPGYPVPMVKANLGNSSFNIHSFYLIYSSKEHEQVSFALNVSLACQNSRI